MTPPTASATAEDFSQLLHMTAHDWRTALDRRLRPMGLSRATWMLLFHVRKLDGPNQTELAEHLGLEGASVVRLVDRLEREGLVERRGGVDRRVKTIHFTVKGEALAAEIGRVAASLRGELFRTIPEKDLAQSRALLRQLRERLAEMA
jgi:MarR family transcriptional regulator for hemolysin